MLLTQLPPARNELSNKKNGYRCVQENMQNFAPFYVN